ncbi:MAG: ABC transporter permease [Kiloniellales bacterium]
MQDRTSVIVAGGCAVALVLIGSLFYPKFLSPTYLLQQLQIASFLGIVALGAMAVILLGHIDLSVPWTFTAAAIASTTVAGMGSEAWWGILAVPSGLVVGLLIGLLNGLGVAYLRLPSMIWTLGMNAVVLGICVLFTGGFNPQGLASPTMRFFAIEDSFGIIPNAVFLWAAVALAAGILLRRTAFGRYVYAIGNRERATYLSGVKTNRVLIGCFMIAGLCSAIAGMLLAGYANQAYQAMGEPYLLPGIAAVVLGGTSILGGRGTVLGTVVGVILISLIGSMLSVMQMPEAGRQIIYGLVIISMLLLYGRSQKAAA